MHRYKDWIDQKWLPARVSDFDKNVMKNIPLKDVSHENILKQAEGISTRTLLERIFREKYFTKYSQHFVEIKKA